MGWISEIHGIKKSHLTVYQMGLHKNMFLIYKVY